jgi:nicotinamidase-related amidase
VIDLQNEFLGSDGHFPILESSKDALLANLAQLLPDFRKVGHIVWVKSIYDNTAGAAAEAAQVDVHSPEAYLAGTHRGKTPCCPKGSVNAELYPEVASRVSVEDTLIIKTYFSAFTKTSLLATLRDKFVKDVFVCGLLSGTCVLATILDAVQIPGFNLYVVQDCLGWRNDKSHDRAVERMQELGVRLVDHQFATQENLTPPTLTIPELYYVNGSIPSWRVHIALYEKVGLFFLSLLLSLTCLTGYSSQSDTYEGHEASEANPPSLFPRSELSRENTRFY